MTSTEFDAPQANDDPRRRGLMQQAAVTAVMILLGLKIVVDVLRRSRRSSGT